MSEVLLVTALLVALTAVVVILHLQSLRRAALQQLAADADEDDSAAASDAPSERPFARRHRVLPWVIALATGLVLYFAADMPLVFAAALAFLFGLLGGQADAVWLTRRQNRIETQLADAIGLMIAAVSVGASLQAALESALREARPPLRRVLEEVVGRILYGDDPLDVMNSLRRHVPLETFHLFATTLAVNWNVGGSLAATLAKVERTIRDRIETTRRVQAMTIQVRVSMIGVLCATYLIAALVWRNSPDRMSGFLASQVGQGLAAAAMIGQGVGIVWISRMSQLKF